MAASLLKEAVVLRLLGTSPLRNVATEEWIFSTTDLVRTRTLLLWRNAEAVVIGRNQNPWREANVAALTADGVPLIRRRSGGGTVYHDLGNINYSFFTDRASFDKTVNAHIVRRALARLNITATVGPRNDLLIGDRKVSGAAYRITSAGAYHHGTMLVDANLDRLRRYLNVRPKELDCRSVTSVRSPVTNLAAHVPGLTTDAFADALTAEFFAHHAGLRPRMYTIGQDLIDSQPAVDAAAAELEAWNWMWGETPEFTHTMRGAPAGLDVMVRVRVVDGLISDVTATAERAPELARALELALPGRPYGPDGIDLAVAAMASTAPPATVAVLPAVRAWLTDQL